MTDEMLMRIRERMRRILKRNRPNYRSARFDTSDVLQDSIAQVARQSRDDEGRARPVSEKWLRSVALGHLAKHLRFHKAGKRSVSHEMDQARYRSLDRSTLDPANQIARRELVEKMLRSLTELDPQQRQIVTLRVFEHLTYGEIADRMNIGIHLVRSGLSHSLKRLRNQVEAAHAGEA